MTPQLSDRVRSMPRSAIREIMSLAAEREGVIHLELGEPEFGTPAHIGEAGCAAIHEGWTRYTPNNGIPALRELIAERVAQHSGSKPDSGRIVVTSGAVQALFTASMIALDPGDEILVPDPGWPNYYSIAHLASARPVPYELRPEEGFVPNRRDLADKVTDRTRAIIVNSPGNPTGAVFSRSAVRDILAFARDNNIFVISDEVYEDIVFTDKACSFLGQGEDERVFVVSGVSKSYAMTGWRIGYLVCPDGVAGLATGLQEPVTSCCSAVSQKAAEAALAGSQDCVRNFRDTYRRRRDILLSELADTDLLPATPEGAFYALVDISRTGETSTTFAKNLLIEHNVAVVPGITFGPSSDRYVRVAFTTDDDSLREGLKRLRDRLGHWRAAGDPAVDSV